MLLIIIPQHYSKKNFLIEPVYMNVNVFKNECCNLFVCLIAAAGISSMQ